MSAEFRGSILNLFNVQFTIPVMVQNAPSFGLNAVNISSTETTVSSVVLKKQLFNKAKIVINQLTLGEYKVKEISGNIINDKANNFKIKSLAIDDPLFTFHGDLYMNLLQGWVLNGKFNSEN